MEAALRAAQGEEPKPQQPAPAALEDHQETYQPPMVGDEDEIL